MAKKFTYRFESLLKIRVRELEQWQVAESSHKDRIQLKVTEITEKEDETARLLAELNENGFDLARRGLYQVYENYITELRRLLRVLYAEKKELEEELKKIHKALVLAHKEVLKFKRLREIEYDKYQARIKSLETKLMDELAQNQFLKQEKNKHGLG